MRILLVSINAKFIHTNNAVRLLKANCDFDVDIMEYTIKDSVEDIINEIKDYNPDVLGFSCYIWNINIIEKLIELLDSPHFPILLGGPEVSYESVHFMNKLNVDYIIKGEGEIAFNELMHCINDNTQVSTIDNLTYKKDGKIYNNPIKEIEDLNQLNLPYFFEEDKREIEHKISYIESSRGCPYKCSYCLSSLEEKVRFFDIEKVKQAILYLIDEGSKTIKFLDRTFNANKNTLELLEFIINHNNQETVFQFEITGDILDPAIIHFLNRKAPKGLFRFEIGIQSVNYETNLLVDRHQNNEKLFSNIKLIQDKGIIDLHLDLIAGLPKEDLQSFKNTFDTVFFLGAKELQLGFLKMLRGTKIRREAEKYNYVYHEASPYEIIENDSLSIEDIQTIHLVEHMLEIYHNKGYFGDEMHKYLLHQPSPFETLLSIGNYYLKNGYKMHGYQIEDIYKAFLDTIEEENRFPFYKDYLLRSKIKPKIFFETIKEKPRRKLILETLSSIEDIPIHLLYKHTVIIEYNADYLIVLYQNHKSTYYSIKKTDL